MSLGCNSVKKLQSVVPLTKKKIQSDYKDCFDKFGKFPGGKNCIKLIDNVTPVVRASQTGPVQVMPFYKAELHKMLADIKTIRGLLLQTQRRDTGTR